MDEGPNVFISHSINFEDVLLRRLFRGVSDGFFVDVGAADPIDDSDTYALSQLGWRGINVEPHPAFFRRLVSERPRDCNLQVAVSDRRGTLDWYQVADTGLSTCDPAEASRAADKGHVVTRHEVETTTLADIFEVHAYVPIDVLKVDVEGLEWAVLSGNDWDRWRPKVVLVEATLPERSERRPDRIRPFLNERGYGWAHFDGLNDWYTEADFHPPADAFLPPNVFDRFISRRQAEAEVRVAGLSEGALPSHEHVASLKADRDSFLADPDRAMKAYADLRRAYAGSRDETRRSAASLMDVQESLRRSRVATRNAQDRYATLAIDFETGLRAAAASRAVLAETEDRLRSESSLLMGARAEVDRLLSDLHAISRGRQAEAVRMADLQRCTGALADSEARADLAEARCRAIESSSSWRLTRPMRAIVRKLRGR